MFTVTLTAEEYSRLRGILISKRIRLQEEFDEGHSLGYGLDRVKELLDKFPVQTDEEV